MVTSLRIIRYPSLDIDLINNICIECVHTKTLRIRESDFMPARKKAQFPRIDIG